MDSAALSHTLAPPNPYDAVPYPAYVRTATHPDNLAAIAVIHGIKPAPVETCRVLELGCASGANLIPMSESLPNSTFVGIDYSAGQIEAANAVIAELGLRNIQVLQKSITDIGPEMGCFDYIICHGVYSWVGSAIRDKILEICRRNLSEAGVAVVSYNTLPGWSFRGVAREMMRYHTRNLADPYQRLQRAREVLSFVGESVPQNRKNYAACLGEEVEVVRAGSDNYLLHDHMEEENYACYFHEFISHAASHDLQFLSEAQHYTMYANDLPPQVHEKVRRLGGLIEQQQWFDFIRNRAFRQTLLCHKHQTIRREFDPSLLRGLYIASSASPGPNVRPDSDRPDEFFTASGVRFVTPFPAAKAMVLALSKVYPSRILFDDLARQPFIAAPGSSPAQADSFGPAAALLRELYNNNAAEFYPRQIDSCPTPSARPVARRLARLQARSGSGVTSLLHKSLPTDPLTRLVIPLLDGTRDREQLLTELDRLVNTMPSPPAAEISRLAPPQRRHALVKLVEGVLPMLATAGLLIA